MLKYCTPSTSLVDTKEIITDELLHLQKLENREISFSFYRNKVEQGKRIFHLFFHDLMPDISSANALMSKIERDYKQQVHNKPFIKFLLWTYFGVLHIGMIGYLTYFGANQRYNNQRACFQTFLFWIFIDLFFVSTARSFLTHYCIPVLMTKNGLKQIHPILLATVKSYRESLLAYLSNSESQYQMEFNTASFFFLSQRVAKHFPDLPESAIVHHFKSLSPFRIFHKYIKYPVHDFKEYIWLIRVLIYLFFSSIDLLLMLPIWAQDAVIFQFLCVAVGYTLYGVLQLYRISLGVACLPLLFLVGLWFIYPYMKNSNARKVENEQRPSNVQKANQQVYLKESNDIFDDSDVEQDLFDLSSDSDSSDMEFNDDLDLDDKDEREFDYVNTVTKNL